MNYSKKDAEAAALSHLFPDPEAEIPNHFGGLDSYEYEDGWVLRPIYKKFDSSTPVGLGGILFSRKDGNISIFGSGEGADHAIIRQKTCNSRWGLTVEYADLKIAASAIRKVSNFSPARALVFSKAEFVCVSDWFVVDCVRVALKFLGVETIVQQTNGEEQGIHIGRESRIRDINFYYRCPELFLSQSNSYRAFDPIGDSGMIPEHVLKSLV